MSLEQYHRKRDFRKTFEPHGRPSKAAGALWFVVQTHDASRLHYDFRLELDRVGDLWQPVLASGVDLAACLKRLADV